MEAVAQKCSLKYLAKFTENTCVIVSFSKVANLSNTFSHRTPPVTAMINKSMLFYSQAMLKPEKHQSNLQNN